MKTTKTILLAGILVFATQFSIAQTSNLKGDINKLDRHKVEMRKNGPEKPLQKKVKRSKLEKCNKQIVKKQVQPKQKKMVLQKKKEVKSNSKRR